MANVKKYTKDNHPQQISAHFSYNECACRCCNNLIIDMCQVDKMEKMRTILNVPINVTSWYRCPKHNSDPKIGGSKSSTHLQGQATDWYCGHRLNALDVLDRINEVYGKRFGIYQSCAKGYCYFHTDCSNINNKMWISRLINGKNSYTYYESYTMMRQALLSDTKLNWKNMSV